MRIKLIVISLFHNFLIALALTIALSVSGYLIFKIATSLGRDAWPNPTLGLKYGSLFLKLWAFLCLLSWVGTRSNKVNLEEYNLTHAYDLKNVTLDEVTQTLLKMDFHIVQNSSSILVVSKETGKIKKRTLKLEIEAIGQDVKVRSQIYNSIYSVDLGLNNYLLKTALQNLLQKTPN